MRHVLSAAALLSLGCSLPALAEPMMQPTRAVYGCVDPRATTALAIPDGRLRNRKWVEYVHRTGHCSLLAAGQPFEVLARQGALALLKSPDASGDTPPVYAQFSDLTEAAATSQAPAASQAAAADPAVVAAPVAAQPLASPPAAADATAQAAPPAQAAPAATAPQAVPPGPEQAPSAPSPAVAAAAPGAQPAAVPTPIPVPVVPPATAPAPVQPAPVLAPPVQPTPAAPVPTSTPTPTPVPDAGAPAVAPSAVPVPAAHSFGVSLLLVLVLLALLGLVGAAVAIARQQRRFAHVEDANWPPRDERVDPLASPMPVAPAMQSEPSPQGFRKSCVEVLERGGWIIQPSFAAGGPREGAPDILGRRRDAVLAVRCRGGNATITPEIVDEVAAMGQQAHAHVIVLATAAPMTRRAHDEAMRLHVHVLAQDELGSLSA